MKLIEILVEELEKHGGWPDGVSYITQDNGKYYKFIISGYIEQPLFEDGIWLNQSDDGHAHWRGFRHTSLAEDHSTAIITREQYETALSAKNDGWIEWHGGECTVPEGTVVDVRYRDGHENHHVQAGIYDESGSDPGSCAIDWTHTNNRYDIVAYRLHNLDDEGCEGSAQEENISDSNTPAWDGKGLPPVGTEFLYGSHKTLAKCLGVGWEMVFACKGDPEDEDGCYEEFMINIGCSEFHPIPTEREKALSEMRSVVTNYNKTDVIHTIEELYDAGYRKI